MGNHRRIWNEGFDIERRVIEERGLKNKVARRCLSFKGGGTTMWTRSFMRTAIIFLVAMAALAQQPAGNAAQWIQLHDGADMGWIRAMEAGESRLYTGTANGIFVSDDQGFTWRYVTLGFKHSPSSMAVDGNTVYVGTNSDGIFRSDDAGETWTPTSDGLRTFKHHLTHIKRIFWPNISQILVTFDEVIAVTHYGHMNNTYLSTNRGDTWHNVTGIWAWWAQSIRSVVQFDGYLWCPVSDFSSGMARSSDNGRTWEWIPKHRGLAIDWVVLHHRLYVVEELGSGRWNEQTRDWEYFPVEGLPMLSWGFNKTTITSSAVHDDRLYVGVSEFNSNAGEQSGVYVFDSNTETWSSAGLAGVRITDLLSHDSILYAGTPWNGIYASTPQRVHPHAKAVTTWGRVKQDALAQD